MTGFLAELGTKLAERWVALLALPGALFLAVGATAHALGHAHALNWRLLTDTAVLLAAHANGRPVAVAVLAAAVLIAASAVGLAARGLGHGVEALWLADRPGWLIQPLVRRRQQRWEVRDIAYEKATPGTSDQTLQADMRNRIALTKPERPTWIGDRVRGAGVRVRNEYGLDIVFAWPRLWLLLPDVARTELTAARAALLDTAVFTAWGLLYLLAGAWWWPAAIIGVATTAVGTHRGRVAAASLADLTEATFDLYSADLAEAVGIEMTNRTVHPAQGQQISERFRKGS